MGTDLEVQAFERRGLLGRRWYFRIVDTLNWSTLATSEAYNTPRARNETGQRLADRLGCPFVPERKRRAKH